SLVLPFGNALQATSRSLKNTSVIGPGMAVTVGDRVVGTGEAVLIGGGGGGESFGGRGSLEFCSFSHSWRKSFVFSLAPDFSDSSEHELAHRGDGEGDGVSSVVALQAKHVSPSSARAISERIAYGDIIT